MFTAADRAEAVAVACALLAESGMPLSKCSCPELARELAARCQVAASASPVGRWLAGDALKPWQHRSWMSVRHPGFAVTSAVSAAIPAAAPAFVDEERARPPVWIASSLGAIPSLAVLAAIVRAPGDSGFNPTKREGGRGGGPGRVG